MDISLGLTAAYAYHHWTADKWEAVQSQFMSETGPTRSDLQALVASNQPYLFNSTSGIPPLHLVKGSSVYQIGWRPGYKHNAVLGRWGSVSMMQCRRGCDDTAVLLATETEDQEQQAVATEETGPHYHGLKTHRSTLKGSSCDCIPWFHAYSDYGVHCGQGGELNPVHNNQSFWMDFCNFMFNRINDNFCVNRNWGLNSEQWCYVDSACPSATPLHGHTRVATKTCGHGDNMLRDYSFYELGNMTVHDHMDISLGLTAAYAYHHWTADKWEAVQSQFMSETGPTRSDLQALVASNQPYLFNSTSGIPPLHLVKGSTVYQIGWRPGYKHNAVLGRWGSVSMIQCRRGCDDTAVLLATETEDQEQQAVATEETGPHYHGLKTHR